MSQAIYYMKVDSGTNAYSGGNADNQTRHAINPYPIKTHTMTDIESSQSHNHNVVPNHAIEIPIGSLLNKQTLLTGLAKACDFPPYFANNWDSAFDCLTDSAVDYLTLDLTHIETINTKDFNAFKSLIEDAYADFGKPQLWVCMA